MQNAIYQWKEAEGARVFLVASGYSGSSPYAGAEPGSNGLALDAEGRLMFARHGDRQIGRLESDGSITVLADRYRGRRLNSPNDLVLHSSGDLYLTDPPFGLPKSYDDPGKAFPVRPDGTLGSGRIFFDGTFAFAGRRGTADGLKVDARGNVFGVGPGGVFVFSPAGELLGWIDFAGNVGNVAWGEDGSTLFVAANSAVYRVRVSTTGAGWEAVSAVR